MKIHVERTIKQPAEGVAPFLFDAANNTRWQSGMKSCEWTTDPPIQIGSQYRQEAEFRGKPVVSIFEVTELDEHHMRIESIESTFPIQVTRTVEPLDDTTCRVLADVSGQPGGVMRIMAAIGTRIAKRSIEADYDRLVGHFEGRADG